MSENLKVAQNTVVAFHYTLVDGDGQELDSSAGQAPLSYLHGAGNIVPGLEKALEGHEEGDHLQVSVPPEEGYGVRDEEGVKTVAPSIFGDFTPTVGMRLATRSPDGQIVPFWVSAVTEAGVTIDFNHPLAGTVLNFTIDIVEVRAATEDEIKNGQPYRPGGCGGCGGHGECGGPGGCGGHGHGECGGEGGCCHEH